MEFISSTIVLFCYIPSTHYMIRQLELFPNELDECWLAGRVFIEEEK